MKRLSNNYLKRNRVIELLKKAIQNKITYISAPIGCGKTIAVKQLENDMKCKFLWIDCDTNQEIKISKNKKIYIVLENFDKIQNGNKKYLVNYINKNTKNKFIIISRKQVDIEFEELFCSGDLTKIDLLDLNFTKEEIEDLLKLNKIKVSEIELTKIQYDIKGYALITNLLTNYLENEHYSQSIYDSLVIYLFKYIDYNIFRYFSNDEMDFLNKISYLKKIDVESIKYILKIENSKEMLDKIENQGSFLLRKNKDEYIIIEIVRKYLQQRAKKCINKKEEKDILIRAAEYYGKIEKYTVMASEYYIEVGEYDNAAKYLMSEPIQHLGITNYEELEKYILKIPNDILNKYPRLCISVANLYSINSKKEKANLWYEKFKNIKKDFINDKEEYDKLNQLEIYYKICLPNTGDIKLIDYFRILEKSVKGTSILNNITFTGNQPSMISGGKDLSNWGKHYKLVYITLNPLVKKLFKENQYGSGEIALADYLYQINKIDESVEYITKAFAICKNIDNLFVAYSLLDKINIARNVNNDIIEKFYNNIADEKAWYLKNNYEARLIENDIINGELDVVKNWIENNKVNIINNFSNLDRYKYFIMAKAYIATERYTDALLILERLFSYAIEYNKPICLIEYHILKSICLYKQKIKDKSLKEMEEAIKISTKYGYIRIFADEGIIVYNILKDLKNNKIIDKKIFKTQYYENIMNEAKIFGGFHPYKYLNQSITNEKLTKKEMEILELIKQGKSNIEICDDLSISLATVKTHINHIYSKLGTKNRVQTINKMKELQL